MNGHDKTTTSSDLFARDGHLTMLSLDRFDAGELSVASCEVVIEHIRDCGLCSERVEEMRHDARFLPPPELVEERPSTVAFGTLAIAATMAAAAALLLIVWPTPQQASRQPGPEGALTASPYTTTTAELDGLSVAGSLDVRVVAGDDAVALGSRDRVPWSDAVSIAVVPKEAGYVAVLVATEPNDDEGDDTGGIELMPEVDVLMPVTKLDRKTVVEYAGDLSEMSTSTPQRIVVVSCPERFSVGDEDDALNLDVPAPEGCSMYELELVRFLEVADS